jgi:hypothetical protein
MQRRMHIFALLIGTGVIGCAIFLLTANRFCIESSTQPLVTIAQRQNSGSETHDQRPNRNQWISKFFCDVKIGDLAVAFFIYCLVIVAGLQARRLRETVEGMSVQSGDIKQSVAEAARSASAMETVAKHIEVSAKAATDSVAIGKERSAAQMRAYLTVLVGGAIYQERDKNLKFEGKPILANTGHTPAHKVSYSANAQILPVPLPTDFTFPVSSHRTGSGLLGPQQKFILNAVALDYVADDEVGNIKLGKGRALYVWGDVTYEDIFGERHFTNFCQRLLWTPIKDGEGCRREVGRN